MSRKSRTFQVLGGGGKVWNRRVSPIASRPGEPKRTFEAALPDLATKDDLKCWQPSCGPRSPGLKAAIDNRLAGIDGRISGLKGRLANLLSAPQLL